VGTSAGTIGAVLDTVRKVPGLGPGPVLLSPSFAFLIISLIFVVFIIFVVNILFGGSSILRAKSSVLEFPESFEATIFPNEELKRLYNSWDKLLRFIPQQGFGKKVAKKLAKKSEMNWNKHDWVNKSTFMLEFYTHLHLAQPCNGRPIFWRFNLFQQMIAIMDICAGNISEKRLELLRNRHLGIGILDNDLDVVRESLIHAMKHSRLELSNARILSLAEIQAWEHAWEYAASKLKCEKNVKRDKTVVRLDEPTLWTIIDGSVYDISNLRDVHPGGDSILRGKGRNATCSFYQNHHKAVKDALQQYRVGSVLFK